jgi:hypothetical protein
MWLLRLLTVGFASAWLCSQLVAADWPRPRIFSIHPLGGQQGTSIELKIRGEFLSNAISVESDCLDLVWTQTTQSSSGKLAGILSISPKSALGRHILRVVTLDGYSTSAIFNVGQFPSFSEVEPNDRLDKAQRIDSLPTEIQADLKGPEDIDIYAIRVRAGERWGFDLRSIEYGSAIETKMFLLDSAGKRLALNDDRSDFNESPFLAHTFQKDGQYHLQIDQYRGDHGFGFARNSSTYILRISALPEIRFVSPLGARVGRNARIQLSGGKLESVESVYLTQARRAEYARMTYGYTMPIHFGLDPATTEQVSRIAGKILRRTPDLVEVQFSVPEGATTGLWQLWTSGPQGISEGESIEIADAEEYDEATASRADIQKGEFVINGILERPAEKDVYPIQAIAGKPLHFWILAEQLGIPHLDSVLELRDASGKKLAENDDAVPGMGTLIGNPDSSLFYTPERDGPLFAIVKDRLGRGGPSYQYRLKFKSERPGFQLFVTPENFMVPRGGSAEIKVHLIRQAGFEGEVSVWFEGMPPGVDAPRGNFRADQHFEPSADGADMIIPEIAFPIHSPASLPSGNYPFRILGVAAAEEARPDRRIVQAHMTLAMGPLTDSWNFIRRPLPEVSMTVCEPFASRLSTKASSLKLLRGGSTTLELEAENIPESASVQLMNLPPGVSYRFTGRQAGQITLTLEASAEAPLGSFEISAETKLEGRWAPTPPIALSILPALTSLQAGK